MTFPILSTMVALPAVGALLLGVLAPLRRNASAARAFGLMIALAQAALAIVAVTRTDMVNGPYIQLTELHSWIPALGVSWALGVTALGLAMLVLACALVPLVLLASWGDIPAERQGVFTALVLSLEAFIVVIFTAQDVFLFYLCFEAMLIPVYFLIGLFGGENRRRAATKFLLYSLAGGLVMLVGVVALFIYSPGLGTGQAFLISTLAAGLTASPTAAKLVFISFMVALAIKAPMVPLHTWLPDTAAAATPGTSVLLIGILDKIGTYGMVALVIPIFPEQSAWAAPTMCILAVISIIYGGLAALAQNDLYRLISYTSVSHFGFMVLGIFSGSSGAATGAMVYMVAHGLSIAGLYLVTGFMARRTGTVAISDLGGMARVMPVIAGTFLISGLAGVALPGLSGFVPEWMVLTGTFSVSTALGLVALLGVVIAAVYLLLPYQRVFTGAPEQKWEGTPDMDARERLVIIPIIAAMLALGLYPAPLTSALNVTAEVVATTVVPASAGSNAPAQGVRHAVGIESLTDQEGTLL